MLLLNVQLYTTINTVLYINILMKGLNKGINVICDIDVQGFKLIQKTGIDHISIFIIPPSIEELRKKITSKGLRFRKCN
jgi:guanylate kinase